MLYLLAMPINLAALILIYLCMGTNWMFGALAIVLVGTFYLQILVYFAAPKAMARRALNFGTAEIETSDAGFRASIGKNVTFLEWTRFKHIWMYPDFVILVLNPLLLAGFAYVPAAGMSTEVRKDFEDAGQRINAA
jgi:hypothetical protein